MPCSFQRHKPSTRRSIAGGIPQLQRFAATGPRLCPCALLVPFVRFERCNRRQGRGGEGPESFTNICWKLYYLGSHMVYLGGDQKRQFLVIYGKAICNWKEPVVGIALGSIRGSPPILLSKWRRSAIDLEFEISGASELCRRFRCVNDSKLRTPIFHKNYLSPAEHLNCTIWDPCLLRWTLLFRMWESCGPMIADCRANYCVCSVIYFDTNGLIWHSILYFEGINKKAHATVYPAVFKGHHFPRSYLHVSCPQFSSISRGCSLIHHPAIGVPPFMETPI